MHNLVELLLAISVMLFAIYWLRNRNCRLSVPLAIHPASLDNDEIMKFLVTLIAFSKLLWLGSSVLIKAQASSTVSKTAKKKSSKRDGGEENPEDFVDPETRLGEKKKLSREMAKTFNPSAVEKSWVRNWLTLIFQFTDSDKDSIVSTLLWFFMLTWLGGMRGGKSPISLLQTQTALNHLLWLWVYLLTSCAVV